MTNLIYFIEDSISGTLFTQVDDMVVGIAGVIDLDNSQSMMASHYADINDKIWFLDDSDTGVALAQIGRQVVGATGTVYFDVPKTKINKLYEDAGYGCSAA